MKALVYKSTGSWYQVRDIEGNLWNARMKGVFKLDDITSTNPIAVGDVVDFDLENEKEQSVIITKIHDRLNFINRFLVACEMYHVPAMILFNKMDLYKEKELAIFDRMKDVYERIGYKVLGASLKRNYAVEEIKEKLKDKTTLISGHSGVGKSTFINIVLPHAQIRTQDVSGWSGKGQHTTTFAEMYDLPFGGKIIDTPGMKEFGLVDVEKGELSGYFPEMKKRLNDCQFNNCLHINEPGCAIKQGVIDGVINEDRYVSYYNILESISEKKW